MAIHLPYPFQPKFHPCSKAISKSLSATSPGIIYTTINVLWLAVGIASSIVIFLWVQHEKRYDRFHKNADQTFGVIINTSDFIAAVNPAGMLAALKEEIPQIIV